MRAFWRVLAYFWGSAAGFQQSTRPFIFSDLPPHEILLTVPSNVLPRKPGIRRPLRSQLIDYKKANRLFVVILISDGQIPHSPRLGESTFSGLLPASFGRIKILVCR